MLKDNRIMIIRTIKYQEFRYNKNISTKANKMIIKWKIKILIFMKLTINKIFQEKNHHRNNIKMKNHSNNRNNNLKNLSRMNKIKIVQTKKNNQIKIKYKKSKEII
jgi:hypothetical protein